MKGKLRRFIIIVGFFLLVFGLSSTHKQAWALDPVLTTPPPSSEISTATVNFGWDAGDLIDEYWLEVGTGPAGAASRDVFSGSSGVNTSQVVTGIPLPFPGDTVYVKLWWRIQADWYSAAYTYTTPLPADTSITSPPDTSELSTALVNFQWTGNGATQYWLEVGTGTGLKDIFDASTGLNTSQDVPITLDGAPVYARVWWKIGGFWSESAEVSYTTTLAALVITSPAPGTPISHSTVTFEWSAGVVDSYQLAIGTTLASLDTAPYGDILPPANTTLTSQEVTDIPLGSPIYVRLWWDIGGVWSQVNYTYNTLAAGMTSPAPGSDIGTETVTFEWNGVDDATKYWLEVGTLGEGSDDIITMDMGLNTSQEVSGILLGGNDVYVRLSWKSWGIWESRDYVYGTTIPLVEMTLPVPGSTLTTSTYTFEWTGPPIVDMYQLGVGTDLAHVDCSISCGDIHSPADTTITSEEVTGIPLDGNPVYVRLWYKIGTDPWAFVDYQYQTVLPAVAPVARTGQTSTVPLDPAPTGSDGDLQRGVAWTNPRFKDNLDGTINDNMTSLKWDKNANRFGLRSWTEALGDCNGLAAADHVDLTDGSVAGDWHLANRFELESVLHMGVYNPAVPDTLGTGQWTEGDPFNDVQSSLYWTSTTFAGSSPAAAWSVDISDGDVVDTNKTSNVNVWCVRGGQ